MVETVYCVHCGAAAKRPVTKLINGQTLPFCCNGCLQVYEMLAEEGAVAPPPPTVPVTPAAPAGPVSTLQLPIQGMSCANCAARVEAALRSAPGVLQAAVDLEAASATVQLDPAAGSREALRQAVKAAGYSAG